MYGPANDTSLSGRFVYSAGENPNASEKKRALERVLVDDPALPLTGVGGTRSPRKKRDAAKGAGAPFSRTDYCQLTPASVADTGTAAFYPRVVCHFGCSKAQRHF
jgi:hypothetical protein